MSGTIGAALDGYVKTTVGRVLGRLDGSWGNASARRPAGDVAPSNEFAAMLSQLRATLDAPTQPTPTAGAAAEDDVEAIWQQALRRSLADGFGPGDALMKQLGEAADARWERRHGADRGHRSSSSLFDVMG